mmetsp:Transcript_36666/g.112989  ORF Transcript_36666/g.112989 Transcript_36666/m.112989 type:complete len:267 (+) Transcript_36666:68-868(+)
MRRELPMGREQQQQYRGSAHNRGGGQGHWEPLRIRWWEGAEVGAGRADAAEAGAHVGVRPAREGGQPQVLRPVGQRDGVPVDAARGDVQGQQPHLQQARRGRAVDVLRPRQPQRPHAVPADHRAGAHVPLHGPHRLRRHHRRGGQQRRVARALRPRHGPHVALGVGGGRVPDGLRAGAARRLQPRRAQGVAHTLLAGAPDVVVPHAVPGPLRLQHVQVRAGCRQGAADGEGVREGRQGAEALRGETEGREAVRELVAVSETAASGR